MNKYIHIILFAVFCSIIAVFLGHYIGRESIYDNYRYYAYHLQYCIGIDVIKDSGIFEAISYIIKQIEYSTSSFLSVYLLSFFGILFGKSRLTYITLLYFAYLLPSVYLTVFIYKKFINDNKNTITNLVMYILAFLNVMLWLPTLRGLPDIAGLLPFFLLMFISLKINFIEKLHIGRMLFLGFVCFLCLIFRRTFTTAIFIWFTSLLIYYMGLIVYNCKKDGIKSAFKNFMFLFVNLFIMTLCFMMLFFALSNSLFEYFISGNMMREMNDQNNIPVIIKLKEIYTYINPVNLILMLIPVIYSFFNHKYIKKPLIILSYEYIFLYFIIFLFLQDMVIENYVQIAVFISIIMIACSEIIIDFIKNKYVKIIPAVLLMLFFGFNFYQMFYMDRDKFPQGIFSYSPMGPATPFIAERSDAFYKLYDILKEKTEENPEAKISSISGERLFDPETLYYHAYVMNDRKLAENIINIPAPLTYGTDFYGYDVDYMVNVTPWVDNGIKPENWLPIYLPYGDFINNTGISKYFEKIEEFQTDDEYYTIHIYKKKSDIPDSEFENILNRFIEKEPEMAKTVREQYQQFLNAKN